MTPPGATAAVPVEGSVDGLATSATLGGDIQSRREQIALGLFTAIPFLAVAAAIPVAWGGWLGWSDVLITVVMYWLTGHGVTVGFHRLFTHKSFKPNRAVKITLAIAGSMAIQGPVVRWVADTESTTSSHTATEIRTRRGATAPRSARLPRACCTRT